MILAAGALPEILTTTSVAAACAVLSVFVVSRRWAFIGEGIGHSGFGGAGTVWMLALFGRQSIAPRRTAATADGTEQ